MLRMLTALAHAGVVVLLGTGTAAAQSSACGDAPDDVFTVTYRPDAFTKELQAKLQAAEAEDSAALLMVNLISNWSLTSGGQAYEVTVDNLEALGFPLLGAISNAVMDDFSARFELGKSTSTASPPDSGTT